MEDPFDLASPDQPGRSSDAGYAQRRLPNRVYWSKTFTLRFESSRDYGQPARFVTRVFDVPSEADVSEQGWEWVEREIHRSPAGRVQVKAMIARESGAVRQFKVERVVGAKLVPLVTLDRDRAQALIDFIMALAYVPIDANEEAVRLDESLIRDLFRDPTAMSSLYQSDPEQFRQLIRNDSAAQDLAALAHRRDVVATFRLWLENDDAFDAASREAGGPERAWQNLFEANPWILGIGLGGQLLNSWDPSKLENVVGGQTIEEAGKRIDALLRTQGTVSSMVLTEIKHHRESLLSVEYRPGCWSPSRALSGAIVQAQQTAYRATRDISEFLADQAPDGSDLATGTFVIRPATYVIIGRLGEMVGQGGGFHRDKFRSFELHRRNLYEPTVLTFDELLARAEWQVTQLGDENEA